MPWKFFLTAGIGSPLCSRLTSVLVCGLSRQRGSAVRTVRHCSAFPLDLDGGSAVFALTDGLLILNQNAVVVIAVLIIIARRIAGSFAFPGNRIIHIIVMMTYVPRQIRSRIASRLIAPRAVGSRIDTGSAASGHSGSSCRAGIAGGMAACGMPAGRGSG